MKLIKAELRMIDSKEVYSITSLQIAEQTGKRHDSVIRDIEVMLDGLGLGQHKFVGSYLTTQNKPVKQYVLPEEEAMILASGYNVKLRQLIVKAFLSSKQPLTQIEIIIESAKALQAVDSRLTQLEEVVADINVNKTVLPKDGYASINGIAVQIGFSHQVAKKFIDIVNPKRGSASKTLPDGSVKQYTTYKMKPVIKFASKVRQSAQPVNANEVYFTSKYTNFRFQIL